MQVNNANQATAPQQTNPVNANENKEAKPINPKIGIVALCTYVALAALCLVGAAHVGAFTLLGGGLIVVATVLSICSLGLALDVFLSLSGKAATTPEQHKEQQLQKLVNSAKQHPYDHRTLADPAKIDCRIKKATANAEAAGEGEYNPSFDAALIRSNPFTGHSSTYDVDGTTVGFAELQGIRPTMEDRHIASKITFATSGAEHSAKVFGIFDGHGGDEAADFASKNIESYLARNLSKYCEQGITDATVFQALRQTLVDLDSNCRTTAGSTACITVMINGDLYTANLGDSRAVLKNGDSNLPAFLGGYKAKALSKDQKPDSIDMLKGVNNRGGLVINANGTPRVNGVLAVARALGDWTILNQNGEKVISPLCKVSKVEAKDIKKGKSKLIIACDGLYDVVRSSSQVAKATQTCAASGKDNKGTAEAMARAAIEAGSTDNVSVMVIDL